MDKLRSMLMLIGLMGLTLAACESPTAPATEEAGGLPNTAEGASASQAGTFTESVKIPIDLLVFVPCAAGGAGEEVVLSGTLHLLFHVTEDASGGLHIKSHANPQGISGIGMATGDKYQGTGVTQDQFNAQKGVEITFINNFRIIDQGAGNNFLVHETFHVTVNANGTPTASVDNFRVECK